MSELTWLSFDMLNLILTILYSKKNDRKIMPCFSCHKVQWLRAVIDLNGKKNFRIWNVQKLEQFASEKIEHFTIQFSP